MQTVLIAVFIIPATLFFSRPEFGTRTLPKSTNAENQIFISLPNHPIPRQIRTIGWPLPGGEFGFRSDPHSINSNTVDYPLLRPNGETAKITIKTFDINPGFDLEYQSHVLAIRDGETTTQILVPGIVLVALVNNITPIPLGIYDNTATFLLPATEVADARMNESPLVIQSALIVTQYPFADGEAKVILDSNLAEWDTIVAKLKNRPSTDFYRDQFCQSRLKPTIAFWTKNLGKPC